LLNSAYITLKFLYRNDNPYHKYHSTSNNKNTFFKNNYKLIFNYHVNMEYKIHLDGIVNKLGNKFNQNKYIIIIYIFNCIL